MALKPSQCCIQATVGEIVKIHIAKNTYLSRMLKTFYKATLHRQPFIELGEHRLYPAPSSQLGSQWQGKSSQEGSNRKGKTDFGGYLCQHWGPRGQVGGCGDVSRKCGYLH